MSLASIPGASDTLVSVLRQRLEVLLGPTRDGYDVELFRSAQFTGPPTNTVSLLLYRVDVDKSRRYDDLPAGSPTLPGTRWLGQSLSLSYMFTVWGQNSASSEQRMLQHCMEILEEFPLDPEDALRIFLDPMSHEHIMRLWDGFDLPYQLSVPYLVQGVRLAPREKSEVPVTSGALAFESRIQP